MYWRIRRFVSTKTNHQSPSDQNNAVDRGEVARATVLLGEYAVLSAFADGFYKLGLASALSSGYQSVAPPVAGSICIYTFNPDASVDVCDESVEVGVQAPPVHTIAPGTKTSHTLAITL